MTSCRVCGVDLIQPKRGRKPSYCGSACRVRAHRDRRRSPKWVADRQAELDVIPAELRSLARWVRHRAKRPIATGGWTISVHDAQAWVSYTEARQSNAGDGYGFVLNGDGIVCIDLDDCVTDGVVHDDAQTFLELLGDSYTEFSPSGRGLHVWGYGYLDKGKRFKLGSLKVEAYPAGRFITVTGDPYRTGKLDVLYFERAVSKLA
jgi:primase-polymerase (primpol)-like protein